MDAFIDTFTAVVQGSNNISISHPCLMAVALVPREIGLQAAYHLDASFSLVRAIA